MTAPKQETDATQEMRPTMPFRRILFQTMGAAFALALVALLWKRWDFSLGAVAGALLACAGLLHLKSALRKALSDPNAKSAGPFLFASVIRWGVWALVLYFLLKVSTACLLGAALSYLIYLAVLSFHGLRHPTGMPSTKPSEPSQT
jgi:hypothetical protein